MQQRKKPQRAGSATPNLKYQPIRQEKTTGNLIVAVALCLLVPPVGIVYAWRGKLSGVIARVIPTLAGLLSMTLIFALIFRSPGTVDAIKPSPVVPLPFNYIAPTAAPAPGVDESEIFQDAYTDGETGDESEDAEAGTDDGIPEGAAPAPATGEDGYSEWDQDETEGEPEPEPTPEPTPETITVFAVAQNATLYHAYETCDGQLNTRELTLDQAKAEGLRPCSKCKPVKYE